MQRFFPFGESHIDLWELICADDQLLDFPAPSKTNDTSETMWDATKRPFWLE